MCSNQIRFEQGIYGLERRSEAVMRVFDVCYVNESCEIECESCGEVFGFLKEDVVDLEEKVNYASAQCGAKIIDSSRGVVDGKSVIEDAVDKYLLMPCNSREKWIVIELCEEIVTENLMIVNYEVFSSMIKNFSVFSSAVFPVSGNWISIGNFTARNSRDLQEFSLKPELAKFVNITFLSFDGDKYYCPVSEIRLTGKPSGRVKLSDIVESDRPVNSETKDLVKRDRSESLYDSFSKIAEKLKSLEIMQSLTSSYMKEIERDSAERTKRFDNMNENISQLKRENDQLHETVKQIRANVDFYFQEFEHFQDEIKDQALITNIFLLSNMMIGLIIIWKLFKR